jgi:GGDEF domain-containing protein
MQPGPPRRRRARPVADAPIDALLLRAEDLAKGWLLALLEQAPLDDAPEILGADLARDGPRVCEAVVRALGSEDDLRRVSRGGALEPLVSQVGAISGARSAESISRAVDALHAVIWSGLREELTYPDPEQIAELAERLSLVIELVRVAALSGRGLVRPRPAAAEEPAQPRVLRGRERVVSDREGPSGATREATAPGAQEATAPGAQEATAPGAQEATAPGAQEATAPGAHETTAPGALWVDALEDEIVRAKQLGAPLSLLLVELEDAERLQSVEPAPRASATFGRFAQAVRSAMRRKDIVALETSSRAWLIARDTGRAGAQALASRIAAAVQETQPWRGAPLTASVGVAVFREDGRDSVELREAAEEARFAASASGVSVMTFTREHPPEAPEPGA